MKLLRHILSHGILLIVLIALAFIYFYRVQLFSTEINAHIDSTVNKALAWTEIFQNKQQQQSDESTAPVVAEIAPVAVAEVQQEAPADTTSQAEVQQEVPADTTSQVVTTEAMPVPEATDTQEMALVETTTSAEPEAAVDNDQAVAATAHDDLLNQARTAYANGNPDQAVKLYEELSELNAEDPNIPGELGNVFYAQGKWQQAGVAYYEAATRLMAHGQVGQVEYLYRVIQGLDQESAEKLRSQLGK